MSPDRPTICTEISERWEKYFSVEYPTDREYSFVRSEPKSNRASVLPHVCENYVLMTRRWWMEEPPRDARVNSIFRQGRVMEDDTRDLLRRKLRFRVEHGAETRTWPAYNITGTIDCTVEVAGVEYTAELKSCHPNLYAKVNSVEDLFHHPFWVYRQYPGQLLLYLWLEGGNTEKGLLILRDKSTSAVKPLWCYMDDYLDYATMLTERALRVDAALRDGTPHLQQLSDPDVCEECWAAHRCAPPLRFTPPIVAPNPEFLALLDRCGELQEASAEHKRLAEKRRTTLEHVDWFPEDASEEERRRARTMLAGRWVVTRTVRKDGVALYKFRTSDEAPEEGQNGTAGPD